MKIYYITEKKDKRDIFFWDADMRVGGKMLSCLAFFYEKEFAEKYKEYLKKQGEEETDMVIRSMRIN